MPRTIRGIFIVSSGRSSFTTPASSRKPTMMRGTPARKDCGQRRGAVVRGSKTVR